uniref:DUF4005 domain-containing protein n=1 Tax=Rhizophora mucronata TaxID=61149 RepID=A0A2P2K8P1_RHIMU
MGFFRRLFGGKSPGGSSPAKEKSRRSFAGSSNATSSQFQSNKRDAFSIHHEDNLDANKHAIAVAAATAAVAEAALAAARAAAEVVRLTNGSGPDNVGGRPAVCENVSQSRRRWVEALAALKIQSAFRGYLARRALRALKALVKLQALVRGHIVRKQTADMLRRMQTLVRLQARARASRTHLSESWRSTSKSSHSHYPTSGSNSNLKDIIDQSKTDIDSNWFYHWMEENLWNNNNKTLLRNQHADDEKSDKILEVDTWKPRMKSQSNRIFQTPQHVLASEHGQQSFMAFDSPSKFSMKASNPMPIISSADVSPLDSIKFPQGKDEAVGISADNSPIVFSASSRPGSSRRRGPFSPTKSEYSCGFFNGYSGYPSYMANTESSRAKVRSQSAPRQRLEFETYGSTRTSVQGFGDVDTHSERSFGHHTDFRKNAYPTSGWVNRLGGSNLR